MFALTLVNLLFLIRTREKHTQTIRALILFGQLLEKLSSLLYYKGGTNKFILVPTSAVTGNIPAWSSPLKRKGFSLLCFKSYILKEVLVYNITLLMFAMYLLNFRIMKNDLRASLLPKTFPNPKEMSCSVYWGRTFCQFSFEIKLKANYT